MTEHIMFTLKINQVMALKWGLNLAQAAVFALVYEAPSWASNVTLDGEVWYHLSKSKVCYELPILTDKPDTAFRHLKALEKAGLIKLTSLGKRTLVQLTSKAHEWNRTVYPSNSKTSKSESTSEMNPIDGKKSEVRKKIPSKEKNSDDIGKKSEVTTEIFPTDEYTSNQNTSDHEVLCAIDSDEPMTPHENSNELVLTEPIEQEPVDQKTNAEYITASSRKLTGENLANFDAFWAVFDYKKDRAKAADVWLKIPWASKKQPDAASHNRNLFMQILAGAATEAATREHRVAAGLTPPYAEKWLKHRRWEDEHPDLAVQRQALLEDFNASLASAGQLDPKAQRQHMRAVLRDVMNTNW